MSNDKPKSLNERINLERKIAECLRIEVAARVSASKPQYSDSRMFLEDIADAISFLVADRQRILDENEKLRLSLKEIFNLMDEGILVRDISKDHEEDWAAKALALTMTLKRAYLLLSVAPNESR